MYCVVQQRKSNAQTVSPSLPRTRAVYKANGESEGYTFPTAEPCIRVLATWDLPDDWQTAVYSESMLRSVNTAEAERMENLCVASHQIKQ